jgi:transcriptional regulator NrdR family protein
VGVIDNSFNPETNEIYRKRRCKNCLYIFYTIESEVIPTAQFRNDFYNNSRYVKNGVTQDAKRKEQRRLAKEKRLKGEV